MQHHYSFLTTLLLALVMALPVSADEAAQWCLVVESAGGETIAIGADLKPVVAPTADGLELKYGDVVTAFAWSELKSLKVEETVADFNATAVRTLSGDAAEPSLQLQRGEIVISGATPGSTARVYATDGRLAGSATIDASGRVVFNANALGRGLYIIKTNKSTFKIQK